MKSHNSFHYLIVLLLFINHTSGITLEIKEAQNKDRFYVERDTLLTLTCVSDSISQSETLEWFLPSNNVTAVTNQNQGRVSVKHEREGNKRNVILTVRDVSTEFQGTYYCRSYIYESNQQILLAQVKLAVALFKPISVQDCRIEQWILINSNGFLKCTMSSEANIMVTWTFNNKILSQTTKYKISAEGLLIYNVAQVDTGYYSVQARQTDHSNSIIRDIMVTVFELPKIVSGPKIIGPITNGVMENNYTDIQCLAIGNPMPTVHWFRRRDGNQELQYANPMKFFVNTNPRVGTMRMYRPQYLEDDDEYTCKALLNHPGIEYENYPKSEISRSINITVSILPEMYQFEQMSHLVEPGKTATIRCRFRATDPVTIVWQRHNGVVYSLGRQTFDPRITVSYYKEPQNELFRVLTLEIKNVKLEDSWNYTCIATAPGFNVSYNGTILVHQVPMISNLSSTREYGWLFNGTNLTCISYGFPYPVWRWSRNFYTIDNEPNSTYSVSWYHNLNYSMSWLQIYPNDNNQYWVFHNSYRCSATNDKGTSYHEIQFMKAFLPGLPQVKLLNVTSSSVNLEMSPPRVTGGKPLQYYELQYRALQGRTILYGPIQYPPIVSNSNSTYSEIRGLVFGMSYEVLVYACTLVGRSDPQILNVRTLGEEVPQPIEIISVPISNYPYTYTLRWHIPLNGGMPITSYRIQLEKRSTRHSTLYSNQTSVNVAEMINILYKQPDYLQVNSDKLLSPEPIKSRYYNFVIDNPYMNYFIFDDLEPYSIYKISVESINRRGFSQPQIFYFVTPEPDPLGKPPRIRGSQNQLLISTPVIFTVLSLYYLMKSSL